MQMRDTDLIVASDAGHDACAQRLCAGYAQPTDKRAHQDIPEHISLAILGAHVEDDDEGGSYYDCAIRQESRGEENALRAVIEQKVIRAALTDAHFEGFDVRDRLLLWSVESDDHRTNNALSTPYPSKERQPLFEDEVG